MFLHSGHFQSHVLIKRFLYKMVLKICSDADLSVTGNQQSFSVMFTYTHINIFLYFKKVLQAEHNEKETSNYVNVTFMGT